MIRASSSLVQVFPRLNPICALISLALLFSLLSNSPTALAGGLLPFDRGDRPSRGDRDPLDRPSKHCRNTGAITSCREHFSQLRDQASRDVEFILPTRIASTEASIRGLKNSLQASQYRVDAYQRTLGEKSILSESLETSHDVLQDTLMPLAQRSTESLDSLGNQVIEALPRLVTEVRRFIQYRDASIEIRLIELGQELESATGLARAEALKFEQRQLLHIQKFLKRFPTSEDFTQAVAKMASGHFDSASSSLPVETQALLLEVSKTQTSTARAIDLFESMRISARKLLSSIEAEVARQGSAVATAKESIRSINQSLKEERERQSQIRVDIEEKTYSVSDMKESIQRQRFNTKFYGDRFECCDDAPHCDVLPDLNRFEESLSREGCFVGRSWTP